jgi:hypothetical protein
LSVFQGKVFQRRPSVRCDRATFLSMGRQQNAVIAQPGQPTAALWDFAIGLHARYHHH